MIRLVVALALWAGSVAATPLDILTDSRLGDARRAALEAAIEDASDWLLAQTGTRITGDYLLLGAERDSIDRVLTAAYQRLGRAKPVVPVNLASLCGGRIPNAIASPDFILVCWGTSETPTDPVRLRSLLVHELVHQIQYDLARTRSDRPADGPRRLGPAWLVEGTAEVFELMYLLGGLPEEGEDLFRLQMPARRSRLTLDALQAHGTVRDSRSYGVARFATVLLARAKGTDALLDYFRALGRQMPQDVAFERAFGQSQAEFFDRFEALRRDYGAARDGLPGD